MPRRCAKRNEYPRRGGVHTKLLKSTDREDFWLVELCVRSLAPRPNATIPLSATAMCHPEQAKRVEPQAKRRGGCRVSGRRDLSWSYGCFCLDPIFAVPARYPYRGSTTGVSPSAQDDTQTMHLCQPNRRAGACSRRRKEYPLCHGYSWGNEYMRPPPGSEAARGE